MLMTASFMDAVDEMAERLEFLEKENLKLMERNHELVRERDLCMREVMRLKMLLDARRARKDGSKDS